MLNKGEVSRIGKATGPGSQRAGDAAVYEAGFSDEPLRDETGGELLVELADQGCPVVLSRLELSSGEFPKAAKGSAWLSPGEEHSMIHDDHSGDRTVGHHRKSSRGKRKCPTPTTMDTKPMSLPLSTRMRAVFLRRCPA